MFPPDASLRMSVPSWLREKPRDKIVPYRSSSRIKKRQALRIKQRRSRTHTRI